jgi:hypothetical protein
LKNVIVKISPFSTKYLSKGFKEPSNGWAPDTAIRPLIQLTLLYNKLMVPAGIPVLKNAVQGQLLY